jgi:phosphatidylethanolamine-binding protein (PEBP) family uncharacterized protein
MSIQKFISLLVVLLAFSSSKVLAESHKPCFVNEAILQLLHDEKVFSYALSGSFDPISDMEVLEATWGPGSSVHLGNLIQLAVAQVGPPVSVTIPQPKESGYYTLFMIDPDAGEVDTDTSPGAILPITNFLHWAVVNIPIEGGRGKHQVEVPYNSGFVVADYLGPYPVLNTGYHRYTFLLYRQSDLIDTANLPLFALPPLNSVYARGYMIPSSFFTANAPFVKTKLTAMNYYTAEDIVP